MALCGIARIWRRLIERSAAMSDWRRDTRLPVASACPGGHRAGIGRALEVIALHPADRAIKSRLRSVRIERIALGGASRLVSASAMRASVASASSSLRKNR
jgi:hypothetical protein